MAITTYGELKTAIQNQAERSDLSANIPDFIALAESRFQREIRVREMEEQSLLTPTSGAVTLPDSFLQMKRVTAQTTPKRVMEYVSPDWADQNYPIDTGSTGQGAFYTIIGNSLKSYPQVSEQIQLTYYEQIEALSDSNTSNWLLEKAPDVYLWASLFELYDFTKDEAGMNRADARYNNALTGLIMADAYAKSGTPVRRASTYVP